MDCWLEISVRNTGKYIFVWSTYASCHWTGDLKNTWETQEKIALFDALMLFVIGLVTWNIYEKCREILHCLKHLCFLSLVGDLKYPCLIQLCFSCAYAGVLKYPWVTLRYISLFETLRFHELRHVTWNIYEKHREIMHCLQQLCFVCLNWWLEISMRNMWKYCLDWNTSVSRLGQLTYNIHE